MLKISNNERLTNRPRPRRTSLALLLLALLTGLPPAVESTAAEPASSSCQQCEERAPQEGPLASAHELRLGKPVEFDDEVGINNGRCFPLYSRDKLVAWLNSYHQTGDRIFLKRCVEDSSLKHVAPGSKGGRVEDTFEELQFDAETRRPRFARQEPPSWSEFSNPSFCGRYGAYWGVEFKDAEPVRVYAIVFDLTSGSVVRKEFLGAVRMESDSRDFFPRPRWDAGVNAVTFDAGLKAGPKAPPPAGLADITFKLN